MMGANMRPTITACALLGLCLACSTAAPGPSLLLAYPGHAAGPGFTPTAVRVATSPDGLAWTDAQLPDAADPASIRGVGAAAHEATGTERLVAWVAGGSDTVFRYALGTAWESATGVHHNHITATSGDPESLAWDSPPSLVHWKEGAWVMVQRTDGSTQTFLYNQGSATTTPLPGIVPAGVPVRHRPVIARDGARFVIALGSIGTRGTPPLQMVTGTITDEAFQPAPGLVIPIRQGTSGATADPVVTRPDDLNARYFVTTDACLAADGHGKFLLGFVESAARVDAVANQTLTPTTGEQRVKLFVAEASTLPTAANPQNQVQWTPWATIPLTGEQGGHPLYLQCAFRPATSREAIVFVTGGDVGGARGFALVPPQAGRPVYQSLPPAAMSAAFPLVPSQGAFSLIPVGPTTAF